MYSQLHNTNCHIHKHIIYNNIYIYIYLQLVMKSQLFIEFLYQDMSTKLQGISIMMM